MYVWCREFLVGNSLTQMLILVQPPLNNCMIGIHVRVIALHSHMYMYKGYSTCDEVSDAEKDVFALPSVCLRGGLVNPCKLIKASLTFLILLQQPHIDQQHTQMPWVRVPPMAAQSFKTDCCGCVSLPCLLYIYYVSGYFMGTKFL